MVLHSYGFKYVATKSVIYVYLQKKNPKILFLYLW